MIKTLTNWSIVDKVGKYIDEPYDVYDIENLGWNQKTTLGFLRGWCIQDNKHITTPTIIGRAFDSILGDCVKTKGGQLWKLEGINPEYADQMPYAEVNMWAKLVEYNEKLKKVKDKLKGMQVGI